MVMFAVSTDGDIVTGIGFEADPVPGDRGALFADADHRERAKDLAEAGAEVASIIVVVEHLEGALWDDRRYATWTTRVGACEALVEGRRRTRHRHFGPDEVRARALELRFPTVASSEGDDESGDYHTAVFDAIVDEYQWTAALDLLEEAREDCRFEWVDDDDEPRELEADEAARRWEVRRRELLAPTTLIDRRRRYDMPSPLDNWDSRNAVQQWYFVSTADGIHWRQGGSGSSGQREDHGRWAHTFGTLEAEHGVAVRTLLLRYDARNTLRLVRDSPSLLVDVADLVGNYWVEHAESDALLKRFRINALRAAVPDHDGPPLFEHAGEQ